MARFGGLTRKNGKARRAWMAWLAMLALLVQAMTPLSVASAYDADLGDELQVICTANGVQTIAIGPDGAPIEHVQTIQCPFCVMHATPALFTPECAALNVSAPAQTSTFARPRADTSAGLWRAQPRPPRGPPLSV